MRDFFEVPEAEELARAGVEGVRVFTVDDYLRDMPLVAVLKERGGEPAVQVRARRKGDELLILETLGDAPLWAAAVSLAATVRASPVERAERTGENYVCLHSSWVIVEALAAKEVVTRLREVCHPDPVTDGAYALPALAIRAFPHCDRISPELAGNAADRLNACPMLSGKNLVGAADVLNRALLELNPKFLQVVGPDLFMADARFETGDEIVIGAGAVTTAWYQTYTQDYQAHLSVGAVEADESEAKVVGKVHREIGGYTEVAESSQDWIKGADGLWRLRRWNIGKFSPDD